MKIENNYEKKSAHALLEMEELLILCMGDEKQQNVPLSLMKIRAEARSLIEDMKVNHSNTEAKFFCSTGCCHKNFDP
jgi:Tc5 transposase DNA-binding domain.